MTEKEITCWLLSGDPSVQYQVWRDLLNSEKPELRRKIASEGWGAIFLKERQDSGHWGRGFYQPKWTSTHYTLLDLKNLGIRPEIQEIHQTLQMIFGSAKGPDGGINPSGTIKQSDVCINGMVLNYAAYFNIPQEYLISVVDFLLGQLMPDGGFNCKSNRTGAHHSSLHTTLSVLEGILEYQRNGYRYRVDELMKARQTAEEFILIHRLFRSDHTGRIIHPDFLKLHHPTRWQYDLLKALDYFQSAKSAYDPRMREALQILDKKKNKSGLWSASRHPGKTHFNMEATRTPSRWNTLRALRVLKRYGNEAEVGGCSGTCWSER